MPERRKPRLSSDRETNALPIFHLHDGCAERRGTGRQQEGNNKQNDLEVLNIRCLLTGSLTKQRVNKSSCQ